MSSIILPKSGEPNLKRSVSDSNFNLKSCCEKLGFMFIDNNIIFRTQNGAPRKALYGDNIHPNALGTGRLACHIKNDGKPFIPKFNRPDDNRDYPTRYNHNIQASRPNRHPPPYLIAINRENDTKITPPFVHPIKRVRFEQSIISNPSYVSSSTSNHLNQHPTNIYHYVYPIDPINGTQV